MCWADIIDSIRDLEIQNKLFKQLKEDIKKKRQELADLQTEYRKLTGKNYNG